MKEQLSESAPTRGGNDVEMASLLAPGSPSVEQEELEVPPLTSYVSTWSFWWKFLKWPVGFLAVNGIVLFISSMLFRAEPVKPKMVAFFSILTALLVGDSFALYRAARHVEDQVGKFEEESSQSSFYSPHLVFAKVSKQLDSFFSQGRAIPKVTFLVNLAFALCALTLSASTMSVASIGFLVSSKGQTVCFKEKLTRASAHALPADMDDDLATPIDDNDIPSMDGIPSDLQRWAHDGPGFYGYRDSGGSYFHLSNGWTFFSGSKFVGSDMDEMDDEDLPQSQRTLIGVAPNGTVKEYSDIRNPRSFVLISNQTNEFCCCYQKASSNRRRRHRWGDGDEPIIVLCYLDSDLRSGAAWKWRHSRYEHLSGLDMIHYKSALWLRLQKYNERGDGNEQIQIGAMDLKTMNVSDVTTLETSYHSRRGRYYPTYACLKTMWALDVLVGLMASIATSVWLLKIKRIPSGVSPVCAASYLSLYALNEEISYALGFIGTIGATLFLLTASVFSRGQRDMVLWALYTTILVMAGNAIVSFRYDPFLELLPLLILAVVIGLLLNHPLLQVMGWLGAILALIIAMTSFVSYDPLETLLVTTPICLVMSCGLAALGYKLAKYRPYFVVYVRRVWRAMKAAEARTGQRGAGGASPNETGLQEVLLRNQM